MLLADVRRDPHVKGIELSDQRGGMAEKDLE